MEIKYEAANRSGYLYKLVREAPIQAHFDDKNVLTLDLKKVSIDNKGGEYNVSVTLTPEDVGKIVEAFYKQAIAKSK